MKRISRRVLLSLTAVSALATVTSRFVSTGWAATPTMKVYKSPSCGCCSAWVDRLRDAGFNMHVIDLEDVDRIKAQFGVPPDLQSCHTALVEGYVIEGHVPALDVKRLLDERPAATGLAVPGMPIGSPGMEQGGHQEAYQVILFSSSRRAVYADYAAD
ncbi:MAG TPA: DUF411 domain-containing protein [Hyphomonas sp.]|nr:DUF411 domain-containing protein [Hyphomonas sp.]